MDQISHFLAYLKTLEPIAAILFACGILAIGHILGKGTKVTTSAFKRLRKARRPASSKELLE